ncbi:MAG: GIY-YIG nuclease family protein [Ignavibacteriales bacterium]|nr:GIY-YIG nuclease family protein [Ignavibacteriales bacterium]
MRSSWIYILRCSDGSYYTGCTTNLEQRIMQHHTGVFHNYTSTRQPVELVYVEEFQNVWDAIRRERQIKRWGRAKKEALIKEDASQLRFLARSTRMKSG